MIAPAQMIAPAGYMRAWQFDLRKRSPPQKKQLGKRKRNSGHKRTIWELLGDVADVAERQPGSDNEPFEPFDVVSTQFLGVIRAQAWVHDDDEPEVAAGRGLNIPAIKAAIKATHYLNVHAVVERFGEKLQPLGCQLRVRQGILLGTGDLVFCGLAIKVTNEEEKQLRTVHTNLNGDCFIQKGKDVWFPFFSTTSASQCHDRSVSVPEHYYHIAKAGAKGTRKGHLVGDEQHWYTANCLPTKDCLSKLVKERAHLQNHPHANMKIEIKRVGTLEDGVELAVLWGEATEEIKGGQEEKSAVWWLYNGEDRWEFREPNSCSMTMMPCRCAHCETQDPHMKGRLCWLWTAPMASRQTDGQTACTD